jgi:hypothetical protein
VRGRMPGQGLQDQGGATGHEPMLLGAVADDRREGHAALLVLTDEEGAVGGKLRKDGNPRPG